MKNFIFFQHTFNRNNHFLNILSTLMSTQNLRFNLSTVSATPLAYNIARTNKKLGTGIQLESRSPQKSLRENATAMQRRCSGAIQQIADGCRRPTGPVPPSFASSPCIAALCCILRDVTGHPRPPTLAETTPSAPATLPLSPRLCPSLGEEKR